jgi:anti-anti-sigma factor
MSGVAAIELDALRSTVRRDDDVVTVELVGNADLRAKKDLGAMLTSLHEEMTQSGASHVVIDVRQLEFMNSSCFKAFVSWLTDIMELPKEEQYRVKFLSNPDTLWQRRSLHALRSYALMIVSID